MAKRTERRDTPVTVVSVLRVPKGVELSIHPTMNLSELAEVYVRMDIGLEKHFGARNWQIAVVEARAELAGRGVASGLSAVKGGLAS